MKEFIIKELRSISKPVISEDVTLTSGFTDALNKGIETWAQDKSNSEKRSINSTVIKVITEMFPGEFGNFLLKNLNKYSRKNSLFILTVLSNYLKNPNDNIAKDNIFELIGMPMLDFFVKKTFGKTSFWSRIMQITPFMRKISTGNGQLDMAIYEGLNDALNNTVVRDRFKNRVIDPIIGAKLLTTRNNQDLIDVFNEGLNEDILGIGGNIRNRLDRVRAAFSSGESKSKFKLMLQILKHLPNIKSDLRRKIRDGLLELDYTAVKRMLDYGDTTKAAEVVTKVIVLDIVEKSRELYFSEFMNSAAQDNLIDIIRDVFLSAEAIQQVRKGVSAFLKESVLKAKEKERQKQIKQNKNKSKYNR